MLPGMFPFAGAASFAAVPAECVFRHSAANSSNLSSYTFTGVNLGQEASDRTIIVAAIARNVADITGVSVGGTPLTERAVSIYGSTTVFAIWSEVIPAGTSASVVVQCSDGGDRAAIFVYSATGLQSQTPTATGGTGTNGQTVSLPVEADGFIIGAAYAHGSSASWTGLDEDADISIETLRASSAHREFTTAQSSHSMSVSINSNAYSAVFAAFR
jgi:hypothetical protein